MLRALESQEVAKYLAFVKAWDNDHLGTGVPFEFFQLMANDLSTLSAATREVNEGRPAVLLSTAIGQWGWFKVRVVSLRQRIQRRR
jgi:hypothetical protein